MIEPHDKLSITQQCQLLGLPRSTYYREWPMDNLPQHTSGVFLLRPMVGFYSGVDI